MPGAPPLKQKQIAGCAERKPLSGHPAEGLHKLFLMRVVAMAELGMEQKVETRVCHVGKIACRVTLQRLADTLLCMLFGLTSIHRKCYSYGARLLQNKWSSIREILPVQ